MTLIGYARISTPDQSLDMQLDALQQAGCQKTFTDVASGAKARRPGFDQMQAFIRPGDTVVVWRLDRLGRNTINLLTLIEDWASQCIGLSSLQQQIDTTSAAGKFFLQMNAAFAENERNLCIERTKAGLAAARQRGHIGGRPAKLTPDQHRAALAMRASGTMTRRQIADQLGVSVATIGRVLAQQPGI